MPAWFLAVGCAVVGGLIVFWRLANKSSDPQSLKAGFVGNVVVSLVTGVVVGVMVYVLTDSGSGSSAAATTTPQTTVGAGDLSQSSTTLSATTSAPGASTTQPDTEENEVRTRDPESPFPAASIYDNSSREFFDGALIVSVQSIESNGSVLVIGSLSVRTEETCREFSSVGLGDAVRLAGDPAFEVQVRDVNGAFATVVTIRIDNPADQTTTPASAPC